MKRVEFEERISALIGRHPWIFPEGRLPPGSGIMPGWLFIVEDLCRDLEEIVPDERKKDTKLLQVKAKFGELRCYLSSEPIRMEMISPSAVVTSPVAAGTRSDGAVRSPVAEAEAKSLCTCCFCGAPGERRNAGGWISTACDRHARACGTDLEVAFDIFTDPDIDPVPPVEEDVAFRIRTARSRFEGLGARRVAVHGARSDGFGVPSFEIIVDGHSRETIGLLRKLVGWRHDSADLSQALDPHSLFSHFRGGPVNEKRVRWIW